MAEYIEREAVLKLFDKVGCYLNPKCLERQQEQIKQLPTADVVEVVRCKDCKYFEIDEEDELGECMCGYITVSYNGALYPHRTDYCSHGKRRCEE